jgi:hypothetical protein
VRVCTLNLTLAKDSTRSADDSSGLLLHREQIMGFIPFVESGQSNNRFSRSLFSYRLSGDVP